MMNNNYPYLNLKRLFMFENYPWEYDFKNENTNGEYQKNTSIKQEDALYKFALYKLDASFDTDGTLLTKNKVDNKKYTCQLTREMYRILFGFTDEIDNEMVSRYAKCNIGDLFGPDTINTFMKVGENLIFTEFKQMLDESDSFKSNRFFSNKFLIHTVIGKKLEINKDLKQKVFEYLDSITTIGNYCLVPAYFNPYRVKYNDYFDLSLFALQCENKTMEYNNKIINWNLNDFNKFINEFLLWDYVYYSDGKLYIKDMYDIDFKTPTPKKFITSNKRSIVEDEVTTLTFIDNAIWSIKRRGFLMALLLQLYFIDSEKYFAVREIMRKDSIDNMNDAINTTLKYCNIEKLNSKKLKTFDDDFMYDIYVKFKKNYNCI